MKLNIYKDETFTEVREVRECERIKIPYRVGQHVIKAVQSVDITDNMQVLNRIMESEEHITAIARATFGLKEDDLAYVDVMEMAAPVREIVAFTMNKVSELKGDNDPNTQAQAQTTD